MSAVFITIAFLILHPLYRDLFLPTFSFGLQKCVSYDSLLYKYPLYRDCFIKAGL